MRYATKADVKKAVKKAERKDKMEDMKQHEKMDSKQMVALKKQVAKAKAKGRKR